eukprot:Gb_16506 [translate_table: standard]
METQLSELGPSSLAQETIKDSSVPDKIQMGSEETSRNEVGSTLDEKLPNLISTVTETGPSRAGLALTEYPTAEELVSKARAPVKRKYIRPAPVRSISTAPLNGKDELSSKVGVPKVSVEKKSKRQLKRERQEEKKSVQNICVAVARAGNVKACTYNGNCRYSHDLEGFLAQKPADLPGQCPFLHKAEPCRYGVACRFAGTHVEHNSPREETLINDTSYEMNGLDKDLQKLIWKNAVTFPKADAQLKEIGILGKGKPKPTKICKEQHAAANKGSDDNSHVVPSVESRDIDSGAVTDKDNLLGFSSKEHGKETGQIDDIPPSKKARIADDRNDSEEICDGQITNAGNCPHKTISVEDEIKHESKNFLAKDESYTSEVDGDVKMNLREKKLIDFRGKLFLAPLTTVGNLPFRRLCKLLGADVTCGEMAMCTNLLQGQASEWALLRRHSSEDLFGVQVCGAYPDMVAHAVELVERECRVDFIDINMGCPIDIVVNKGAGSALLTKPARMQNVIKAAAGTMENPLTVKVRTGYFEGKNSVHSLVSDISKWGVSAITIHGRTRQQRYSKLADWDYIYQCARQAPDDLQVVGNGDVFSYTDWNEHLKDGSNLSTCMIARGALIKPWIFTEIKEQRHWDISSGERLEISKDFVRFGLQHWGSDKKGVETTRYFLLEWLSYSHRYIPVSLLDVIPQRLNWRPPSYFGRNDLETLMASDSAADWVRLSEMLLGPAPAGFTFTPKHKSNAYDRAENG